MTEGLVAGRFHVRALLGSGGTAAVFSADDVVTGRTVALKLLHPHLAADRAAWDAFFEEVRAAQSIDHPGLAEVYDAGVDESSSPVVWIAMELVDGVTLADRVRDHGPLDLAAATALAGGLLAALSAAHARGVVHRDVTPANVMLDAGALEGGVDRLRLVRSVRLLDFGLADIPGRSTVGSDPLLSRGGAGSVVASVPYASPEQLLGAPVTEASDVYQAGATLYFALTGHAPFAGDADTVIRGHLGAPPPVPSVRRPGIPRALDRVVTTAMLKRPSDRYADAATMRSALAGAMAAPAAAVTAAARTPPAGDPGLAVTDVVGSRVGHAGWDAANAMTGVTRVYRTAVPETAPARAASPQWDPPPTRWQPWAVVGVAAAVLTVIIGLSAAAGGGRVDLPAATPSETVTPPTQAEPSTPPPVDVVPTTAQIPDLVGRPLAEARSLLEAAGLVLGSISPQNSPSAAETVLASDPGAETVVSEGAVVAVTVASGDNAVPALTGLAAVEAQGALAAAGFVAQLVEIGTGTAGIVVSSDPGAGAVARVGSTVVVHVPARAPSPTPTPTPTSTPSSIPTPPPTGGPSPSPTP